MSNLEERLKEFKLQRKRAEDVMMGRTASGFDPVQDMARHVKFLDYAINQTEKQIKEGQCS
jgi:hypothetical protein